MSTEDVDRFLQRLMNSYNEFPADVIRMARKLLRDVPKDKLDEMREWILRTQQFPPKVPVLEKAAKEVGAFDAVKKAKARGNRLGCDRCDQGYVRTYMKNETTGEPYIHRDFCKNCHPTAQSGRSIRVPPEHVVIPCDEFNRLVEEWARKYEAERGEA